MEKIRWDPERRMYLLDTVYEVSFIILSIALF